MQAGDAFGQGGGGFGSPAYGRPAVLDPYGARVDLAAAGALGPRIVAWLIDAVIATLVVGALALAFGILTIASLGLLHPLFGLLGLVPFLYTWLCVGSRFAATPGQAICGISVRDSETLERPGLSRAFIWTLGYVVTLALGGIWLLVGLFTRRHRTLHDLLAGVVVVRLAGLQAGDPSFQAFRTA